MIKISQDQIDEVVGFFARQGICLSPDTARVFISSAKDGVDESGDITSDYDFSTLVEKVVAGEGGNLKHDCIEREYYKKLAKRLGMGFSEVWQHKNAIAKSLRKITKISETGASVSVRMSFLPEIPSEHRDREPDDEDIRRRTDKGESEYMRGENLWRDEDK